MPDPRTAEDLISLVDRLPPEERARFLRILLRPSSDRVAYEALPPRADELSDEADPLAWDADGWDDFSETG